MKNAFSKFYNYLLGILAFLIPALIGFLCWKFISNDSTWPLVFIGYTMMFGGVVLVGGGFIVQDVYRAVIRKRINDWDNKLDKKYIDKAWAIYFPMFFGGSLSILAGFIFYLFVR